MMKSIKYVSTYILCVLFLASCAPVTDSGSEVDGKSPCSTSCVDEDGFSVSKLNGVLDSIKQNQDQTSLQHTLVASETSIPTDRGERTQELKNRSTDMKALLDFGAGEEFDDLLDFLKGEVDREHILWATLYDFSGKDNVDMELYLIDNSRRIHKISFYQN